MVMGGNVRGEGRERDVWGVGRRVAWRHQPAAGGCDGVLAGVIVGSGGNTPSYTRNPVSKDVPSTGAAARFAWFLGSLDRVWPCLPLTERPIPLDEDEPETPTPAPMRAVAGGVSLPAETQEDKKILIKI